MPPMVWNWFWVSALAVPLAATGFSRGARAARLFSGAILLLMAAGWAGGVSWGWPAGCVTAFLMIPWGVDRLERGFRVRTIALSQEEVAAARKVRELEEEENSHRSGIQAQEEATQEIAQLYDLSKRFLGTLEPEQGLEVTGEFLEKWLQAFPEPTRDSCLRKISALMEKETLAADDLARALPLEGGDQATRERWAIAGEQLALGLQRLCLYRKVQESATHDGLTGLLVRRYFFQRLQDELDRARRRSSPATFLMVDLDRFKAVNDTYGHLVGDVVLREVAQQIRSSVREMDLVGRYGGEEFEVVLPEADLELGMQIAERIRRAVEGAPIRAYDEQVRITVSIGAAVFPRDAQGPAELIERADEALYRAKGRGRNQTAAWSGA